MAGGVKYGEMNGVAQPVKKAENGVARLAVGGGEAGAAWRQLNICRKLWRENKWRQAKKLKMAWRKRHILALIS